ncbi:hypothetical protein AHAS_Ahas15G0139000 [Arachis hypogaea]
MMRHMCDCIRSDKNVSLPYDVFLTCIFESFGPTRTEKVVLDDDDDELHDIPPPSISRTSASTDHKSLLYEVVKDVLQEFVNLSNHLISTSQQERKFAVRNGNALQISRNRIDVLLKYVDNIHEDNIMATD